jgi:hypothetical protein
MRMAVISVAMAVAALVPVSPAVAHHSFAGVYDQSNPLRVEGIVQRIEWKNPHVVIALKATDTDAADVQWVFEMGAPRVLLGRLGWTEDAVKVGDRIGVEGFHARAGGQQAAAVTITTRSGARLTAVLPFR